MVHRNLEKKRLHFSTTWLQVYKELKPFLLLSGHRPMKMAALILTHVLKVASEVGKNMNDYMVVVTKSTVPVGNCRKGSRSH